MPHLADLTRIIRRRAAWALTGLLAVASTAFAAAPGWWGTRGVLATRSADDYAPANQGQLKNLTRAAKEELDARLAGGAGSALTALVQSWKTPPAPPAPQPDDYALVNEGQLKATVALIYDRLVAAGRIPASLAGHYPWTPTTTDDSSYAPMNLGQLKAVFDFDLTIADRDGDGLDDLQELVGFLTSPGRTDTNGNGIPDAYEDIDGDGIGNRDELDLGLNPFVADGTTAAYADTFTYDTLGRVTQVKNRAGATSTLTLDEEGNILSIAP